MKILNEFGIAPTRNHTAAGYDFYVPNIKTNVEDSDFILEAFSKSYKKSIDELKTLIDRLVLQVTAIYGEDFIDNNVMNVLLLYLCVDSSTLQNAEDPIDVFVDKYLIFDANKKPGVKLQVLDHICINSGIHTCLKPGTAGIFFNKSGRGLKGFDVRACVVDEDYTGFVHLSLSYTKNDEGDGIFYVGDKITQMVIVKVGQEKVEEVDKDMYETLMSGSKRGSKGFGSSDEKH